jgi:hypothetical protein
MSKRRGPIRWLAIALGVAVVAGCGPWASAAAEDDPVLARAYRVQHRSIADAADLVSPLLSPDGQLTLRPRLKVLVVEDRVSVLDKVGALIESFDLPPRNVEVTLSLFLGMDRMAAVRHRTLGTGTFSKEVRGVIDALGDVTKWVDYEPLGSRSVVGVEGSQVTAGLSDEYRVTLDVESIHESDGTVKFRRVSLQRLEPTNEGGTRVTELYTAGMVLTEGRLHVVGAAREPGSDRALFLIVQVRGR